MCAKVIALGVGLVCFAATVGWADEAMQRKMQPVMEKYQAKRQQIETECRAKFEQLQREEEAEMKRLMTEEERAQFERMIPPPTASAEGESANTDRPFGPAAGGGMKAEPQTHFEHAQHEFEQMKQHQHQFEQMMDAYDPKAPQAGKKRKDR